MRECRCGRTIPKDWPQCAECLKYEALSPDQAADRTLRRQNRKVKVFKHMTKRARIIARLAEMRSDPEVQQEAILSLRREMRQRESNRAARVLREWGEG